MKNLFIFAFAICLFACSEQSFEDEIQPPQTSQLTFEDVFDINDVSVKIDEDNSIVVEFIGNTSEWINENSDESNLEELNSQIDFAIQQYELNYGALNLSTNKSVLPPYTARTLVSTKCTTVSTTGFSARSVLNCSTYNQNNCFGAVSRIIIGGWTLKILFGSMNQSNCMFFQKDILCTPIGTAWIDFDAQDSEGNTICEIREASISSVDCSLIGVPQLCNN